MKRDFSSAMTDDDGRVSYQMLQTYNESNVYESFAHRYLKILLSDRYGGLLKGIKNDKTSVNVQGCVSSADRAIKMLAAQNPGSIYSVYDHSSIKKLDINRATSSLILMIDLHFKGGGMLTISI